MHKFKRTTVIGLFGFGLSLFLLLIQFSTFGKEQVSEIRRQSLSLGSVVDASFGFLRIPNDWLRSRQELIQRLMTTEMHLRELEAENVKLQEVKKINDSLMGSLSLVDKDKWIPAQILIGGNTYFLNVGSSRGVSVGSVVTSLGNYVGVVLSVQNHISSFSTPMEVDGSLGVRIESTRALGVLNYKNGELVLTTISRAENVKNGDRVITLGDERVRQSGILVGTIASNLTHTADPISTFLVKLSIDPRFASAVLVSKE